MYIPKHFSVEEFVPELAYQERGEQAWELLDERMLITADQCREEFGPTFVNTWFSERLIAVYGRREWSGLRTLGYYQSVHDDDAFGLHKYLTSYSQHKYGRAFDALFRDTPADEARDYIRRHPKQFPYLTAMETGTSWFHGDVRNVRKLMEFTP
ncbi:hypothetical protein [Kineobactrum salinum]|uniref:Uncharacterized protein n=1 Tax=Kineobactrum salinum TaxID=2708301 RepID=A0A6C0U828_9GAMM|nr:hypothetical protein [Kineobactrum salinum]QIB67177.1 hypothetical protein G3T16_18975 [Kineobactrum salinum]